MSSTAHKWQSALKKAAGISKSNDSSNPDDDGAVSGGSSSSKREEMATAAGSSNATAAAATSTSSRSSTAATKATATARATETETATEKNSNESKADSASSPSVKAKWQTAFKRATSKASGVVAAAAAAASTSVTSVTSSSSSAKDDVSEKARVGGQVDGNGGSANVSSSANQGGNDDISQNSQTARGNSASSSSSSSVAGSLSAVFGNSKPKADHTPRTSNNKKRLSSMFLRKRLSVRRSVVGNQSSNSVTPTATRARAVMEKLRNAKNDLQSSIEDTAHSIIPGSDKAAATGGNNREYPRERRTKPQTSSSLDPSPDFQQFHGRWDSNVAESRPSKTASQGSEARSPGGMSALSSRVTPMLFQSLSNNNNNNGNGQGQGEESIGNDDSLNSNQVGEQLQAPQKMLSIGQMQKLKAKQALVAHKKKTQQESSGPSKEGAIWNKLLRTSLRLVTAKRRVMAKRVKLHNVWGNSLDTSEEFHPPRYPKSPEDCECIRKAMTSNFVFDNMVLPKDMDAMMHAFETIAYQPDTTIVEQGEQGWFFYIVKSGSVSFYVNGEKRGSAHAGNTFGELALLYSCPRAASVRADGDGENGPTILFRVYQMSFRHLMRAQIQQSVADRIVLLRSCKLFQNLQETDLKQLSLAMVPHVFQKGDSIISASATMKEQTFCVIQEGEAIVKADIRVNNGVVVHSEDVHIGPGQHFGEDSLSKLGASGTIGRLSDDGSGSDVTDRPAEDPTQRSTTMTALSKGIAYTIDKETFEKVFGDMNRLAIKTFHKQRLEGVPAIQNANLTELELDTLSRQVEDKTFGARRVLFTRGSICTPALYMIEKGSVKCIGRDGTETIVREGGHFGQEFLELDPSPAEGNGNLSVKAKFTAFTLEPTVCGILTLRECRLIIGQNRAHKPDGNSSITSLSAIGSTHTAVSSNTSSAIAADKTSSSDDGTVSLNDFERHRILGTGLFGKVWLVSRKADGPTGTDVETAGQYYALKVQSIKKSVRPNASKLIRGEIKVMKRLQHPFVVRLIHTFQGVEEISMLMEAAPGGELFDIIHQEDEHGNWASGIGEIGKFYAMVIADTLAFMHRRSYVYRDLKPENVLIDSDGYPMITDFGFTKKVTDKTYTFCGTPNYLPPEIIRNRGHDVTADNWCLGVLIYELIEGENPFFESGMNQMTLYETICKEPHYPLPEDSVSAEAIDLVNRLLEKDPHTRLGTFREKDILEHPWFKEYDLKQLRNKEIESPWVPDAIEA